MNSSGFGSNISSYLSARCLKLVVWEDASRQRFQPAVSQGLGGLLGTQMTANLTGIIDMTRIADGDFRESSVRIWAVDYIGTTA